MKIWRMNGAGNAFLMIDARGRGGRLSPSAQAVQALAAAHSFDQLIAIESEAGAHADLRLRVWNRDGTEVGACGNGTRAAAWLVFQDDPAGRLIFDSAGGRLGARRLEGGEAEVDLGPARLDWRDIPLAREMDTVRLDFGADLPGGGRIEGPGAVSMGNPHAVFFVDDAETFPVRDVGPAVETDPLFPEKTNVGFAQICSPEEIRLKVWERGAGLTLACGTGAAAALVAAHRRGLAAREAVVVADGGRLPVRWTEDGRVHLGGPVELEGGFDLPEPLEADFAG
ncbi:MAG: diaminopimelate epimerase [Oceanicaulis sp.]